MRLVLSLSLRPTLAYSCALTTLLTTTQVLPAALSAIQTVEPAMGLLKLNVINAQQASTNSTTLPLLLLFTVCRAVLLPPISSRPTNAMNVCSIAKPVLQALAVIYASPLTSSITVSVWPRVQLASPLTQSLETVIFVMTLNVSLALQHLKSAKPAT